VLIVHGRQISLGGELITPTWAPARSVERVDDEPDVAVVSPVVAGEWGPLKLCAAVVDRPRADLSREEYLVPPYHGR
jgi:hypothetical protein